MNSVSVGWERVLNSEPNGLAVSAVGMCIVFVSLVLISAFIAALPHLLKLVSTIFPDSDTKAEADHDRIAVAIATALYHEKYSSQN